MQKKFWLCSLFFSFGALCSNVHVVMDTGATIDIRRYMSADERSKPSKSVKQVDVKEILSRQYPLVSEIPQAFFEPYQLSQRMPANFALVGTDDVSQAWLKVNFQRIRDTGALVVVIDAPNLAAFNHFQSVLTRAGLKVVQSQSKPFKDLIKAYPALVADGVVYP